MSDRGVMGGSGSTSTLRFRRWKGQPNTLDGMLRSQEMRLKSDSER